MAKSPLTLKIDAAIAKLRHHDMPVTPESVRANLEPGWDDVRHLAERTIMQAIRAQMRADGMVIADASTRERKDFWEAGIPDLEEQLRIKQESNTYDRNRIKADKAVIAFLKEKEGEFGYTVCPDLFRSDIDRIYRMHSLTPPGAKEAAA